MMEEAFRLIDDPAGESTYLRLSTRSDPAGRAQRRQLARRRARTAAIGCASPARTPKRRSSRWARSCPKRSPPGRSCSDDVPGPRPARGHLARPAPPRLDRRAGGALGRANASRATSSSCCRALAPDAGLVTIADAAPASLSWLGGVLGQRVAPLGVEKFGQTGNLADLYAAYRLDGAAITEAVAELLLPA